MTVDPKQPRINPRFRPQSSTSDSSSVPEATPVRPAIRPRPNTPLIADMKSCSDISPIVEPKADKSAQELNKTPIEVDEQEHLAILESSAKTASEPYVEPMLEQATPPFATNPDPGESAPQVQNNMAAPKKKRARSVSSPFALGTFLDNTFGVTEESTPPSRGNQGRIKFNLNFPLSVNTLLMQTGQKPGTTAREAAIWALCEAPPELTREILTEAARKIAEARKRANNPASLTYPVTLMLPGIYNSAVKIACDRCGMAPVPFFEAVSILYVGYMLNDLRNEASLTTENA